MTDDHVLKLWTDAWRQEDSTAFIKRANSRLLRFAALLLQDSDNEMVLYRSQFERDMTAQLDREYADRIASLEGDVDEAEQRVVDLLAEVAALREKIATLEKGDNHGAD